MPWAQLSSLPRGVSHRWPSTSVCRLQSLQFFLAPEQNVLFQRTLIRLRLNFAIPWQRWGWPEHTLSQGMGTKECGPSLPHLLLPSPQMGGSIRPLPAPRPRTARTPRLDFEPHLTDSRPGTTPGREQPTDNPAREAPLARGAPPAFTSWLGGAGWEERRPGGEAGGSSSAKYFAHRLQKENYRSEQLEVHRELSGRYRGFPSLPHHQHPPSGHSLQWMTLE